MNTLKILLPAGLAAACALAGCRQETPAPPASAPLPPAESVPPARVDTAPPVEPDVVRGEATHEETETEAPELPPGTEAAPDPEP